MCDLEEVSGIQYLRRTLYGPGFLCRVVIGATFRVASDYLKSRLMFELVVVMIKVVDVMRKADKQEDTVFK